MVTLHCSCRGVGRGLGEGVPLSEGVPVSEGVPLGVPVAEPVALGDGVSAGAAGVGLGVGEAAPPLLGKGVGVGEGEDPGDALGEGGTGHAACTTSWAAKGHCSLRMRKPLVSATKMSPVRLSSAMPVSPPTKAAAVPRPSL